MERYRLNELFNNIGLFNETLAGELHNLGYPMELDEDSEKVDFIGSCIYGYFYNDLVAYEGESGSDVSSQFLSRLTYDIWVKLPYWFKKYDYIKKLLTTDDLSLLQTSKMTSSSTDTTKSSGGTLQKTATTPTGVATTPAKDEITLKETSGILGAETYGVETNGFADKYANAQQKFANATKVTGNRSGTITREGSIDELLKVLEKLPSSFADEVTRDLQKHFIFDYDGEERGYYDN